MSFVYYLTDGEAIKIGYASCPRRRRASLQSGNTRELVLLAVEPSSLGRERRVHSALRPSRFGAGGKEWFLPSTAVIKQVYACRLANPISCKTYCAKDSVAILNLLSTTSKDCDESVYAVHG